MHIRSEMAQTVVDRLEEVGRPLLVSVEGTEETDDIADPGGRKDAPRLLEEVLDLLPGGRQAVQVPLEVRVGRPDVGRVPERDLVRGRPVARPVSLRRP